jgi:predicted nucleic acid-binding protein
MILLDTDTCINIIKKNQFAINKANKEKLAVSFMSIGELLYGISKATYKKQEKITALNIFLSSTTIIDSDNEIMQKFGELKTNLYQRSMLVPDADILIAATALSKCSKLITGNIKHFDRFENLIIENWIR